MIARIAEQHLSLLETAREIEDALEAHLQGDERAGRATAQGFARLASELLDHFFREEQGGFLTSVAAQGATEVRKVEKLLSQHRDLEQRAEALVTRLGDAGDDIHEDLAHELRHLLHDLRGHEAAERSLMQRTATRDIGAVD
jgi:hypothetical protein